MRGILFGQGRHARLAAKRGMTTEGIVKWRRLYDRTSRGTPGPVVRHDVGPWIRPPGSEILEA